MRQKILFFNNKKTQKTMNKKMKNYLNTDELLNMSHIMSSDEDQPMVNDVYAALTPCGDLIIGLSHHDYDDPRRDCATWVKVKFAHAHRLAKRLGIGLLDLPSHISFCMSHWGEVVNADLDETRDCLGEIIDCLLDEKCDYSIHRTYGSGGYMAA